MTDQTTEPLDLEACRENLNIYLAQGDAGSCRDIALFAIREIEALRRDLAANEGSEDARLAIAEDAITHLRGELETIGNLAYRCNPASPFVAEALEQIHTRAKKAVQR